MARAILSHEAVDPDFQWLLSNYSQRNPNAFMVEGTCLPVTLVLFTESERLIMRLSSESLPPLPLPTPAGESEDRDDSAKD